MVYSMIKLEKLNVVVGGVGDLTKSTNNNVRTK